VQLTVIVPALALVIGLFLFLAVVFRRVTRTSSAEVDKFRRRHHDALAELVDGADVCWLERGEEAWAAVVTEVDGVELRLEAAQVMQRDTFIEYLTRVTLNAAPGEVLAPPSNGLPVDLAERIDRLAVASVSGPGRVTLTARPSGGVIRRYSYAVQLQLDVDVLRDLHGVARELARVLSDHRDPSTPVLSGPPAAGR
jgi:hypothetical protein